MAESARQKRMRELGVTSTSSPSTSSREQRKVELGISTPTSLSTRDKRKMELGVIPDTRKAEGQKQIASFKQAEQQFGHISADPSQSPVMQQANQYAADHPTWGGIIDNPIGRTVGKGFEAVGKAYDKVSHLPVVNQVTGAMQGAIEPFFHNNDPENKEPIWKKYLGNAVDTVNLAHNLTNPASLLTGNLIPSSKDKNLLEKGKAALQAPSGMIKGALHPDQARKELSDSLKSKSLVTNLAVGSLADPLSYVPIPSIKGIKGASSAIGESFDRMFGKVKPIESAPIQQAGPILGLPEPKSAIMARELENRSVLPANTDVIHGQGNVPTPETLGLPQGQYTPPTRMKVNNPTETLDYVMTKIKPQVMAIIEAPTRRDLLVQYIQKNTGYAYKDIANRPTEELKAFGEVIQNDLHGNMQQIAFDVAKQQGHDLPALLEGQAPTLRAQLAKDTQSQVYGVQPPKIGIQKPEFNVTHNADAAMPITKIGRPSSLREVAATTDLKPRVEPLKGTVTPKTTVKSPSLKEAAAKTDPIVTKPAELKPKSEFKPIQQTPGIRANYRNQLKNGNLSPELKKRIGNTDKTYEKVTNEESLKKANESIQDISVAESKFNGNKEYSAEHVATGYRLIQELDRKAAAETNAALKESLHQRSLNVANKLAKDLTGAGQTVQAANLLAKLSPEGQLLNLTRQAEKNGKVVSVADKVKFQELAVKVQKNAGAGVKANQFTEILGRAAKGEKLTPDDIKKMSDYLASAENNVKPKAVKVADDLPAEFKDVRKRDKIVSFLDDSEQAALARIKARKNNLNSLPIGEWADHAIVVSAQIAKGTIKAATHVEDLVKLFGEEIRPVATQVFQKAQSLVKSVSPGISANDMTKANKAFERISGQVKEMNLQEKVVEKYLKENRKVSPKDIDTLRELARNVTKLSGSEGVQADIAMQKILNSYEKSNPWEKAQAVRYMAMLLNSGTQLVNAASGPIMATMGHVADVFGTMVDVAMHQALKNPRSVTTYGANPLRFMSDYFKHLKVGAPAGWHGVSPGGIQNAGEIRGLTFKSNYNPLNWAERSLGAVAKGADYATYKTIFDSEMRKSGFLDAINSGIKRSDRAAIKAHVQKFVNEPTEEALLNADRIGKNTTFQRSDSTGGKVANFLSSGPAVTKPLVGAVVPFVRTPINMASSAVSMTPAGILKGLWQLTSKSKASQREAIRTLSLGVTGTFGTSALGYYLSKIGVITGANDSGDKNVDAIREQAGKGKYRFNTSALKRYLNATLNFEGSEAAEKAAKYQEGDHAFDYNRFQPIAFPLAIGASLQENKNKPLMGKLGSAGSDAYGSLFGMSTLKGVQDVFQPQYNGTQGEKQLGVASRVAESFFKSFSPSMLAQEARRQDPIARKTPYNNGFKEDVKGYFKSRTPVLSQSLPANKTTLGMNKTNAPGFSGQYVNPYKSEIAAYSKAAVIISDLIDRTGDNSLAPSAPVKTVEVKNKAGEKVKIAIPQDRYEQLQEEIGHNIILKITAMDLNLSDAKKAEKIKDIYAKVRKKEMDKVEKELKPTAN